MRGVIREDDFAFSQYDNPNLSPDRDPWDDDFRSKNHFYGPLDIGNLTPTLVTTQTPDPASFCFPDTPVSDPSLCPAASQ